MAVIGIFLLTQSTGLSAREPAEQSWENLKQLKVGHEIQVVQMKIKSLQGTFLDVSEEVISLRVKENEAALPGEDVLRVSSREKSKRLRNTLIGLGAGSWPSHLSNPRSLLDPTLIGHLHRVSSLGILGLP